MNRAIGKDEYGRDITERLVRKQETNLGDFTADALYYLFDARGLDIDGAIVTGKGINENLGIGNVYTASAVRVSPYQHFACLQQVTGQQLLDALEWGARRVDIGESAAFVQVSGITYEIYTTVSPNVKAEDGNWVSALRSTDVANIYENYRVRNVTIGGEALDLNATYNIAGYDNIMPCAEALNVWLTAIPTQTKGCSTARSAPSAAMQYSRHTNGQQIISALFAVLKSPLHRNTIM